MKRQKMSFMFLLAFFLFNSINAQELFNENNKNFHAPLVLAIKAEADKGNARAQAYIGFSYEKGIYFTKNEVNAVKYYKMSAEQNDLAGEILLGMLLLQKNNLDADRKAVIYLHAASQKGNAMAKMLLGAYYQKKGLSENDAFYLKKSLDCFVEVSLMDKSELFAPESFAMIGLCYEKGYGTEKNITKAIDFYEKAAIQGYQYAQYRIIECYLENKQGDDAMAWVLILKENGLISVEAEREIQRKSSGAAFSKTNLKYNTIRELIRGNQIAKQKFKNDPMWVDPNSLFKELLQNSKLQPITRQTNGEENHGKKP